MPIRHPQSASIAASYTGRPKLGHSIKIGAAADLFPEKFRPVANKTRRTRIICPDSTPSVEDDHG